MVSVKAEERDTKYWKTKLIGTRRTQECEVREKQEKSAMQIMTKQNYRLRNIVEQ